MVTQLRLSRRVCQIALIAALTHSSVGCESKVSGLRPNERWQLSQESGPLIVDLTQTNRIEAKFVVVNPSSANDMVLELESRSCRCIDYSLAPDRVPPNGEAQVILRTVASSKSERMKMGAVFKTGLVDRPKLQLDWVLDTRAAIEMIPAPLPLTFLEGSHSGQTEFSVVSHSLVTEEKFPVSVVCEDPTTEVVLRNESSDVQGSIVTRRAKYRLIIPAASSEDATSEGTKSTLRIQHGKRVLAQEVRWVRKWAVTAVPEFVFFQPVATGAVEKAVIIRGDRPFAIRKIRGAPSYLQTNCNFGEIATEHTLKVMCNPTVKPQKASSTKLIIELDHPDQSVLQIPVHILW